MREELSGVESVRGTIHVVFQTAVQRGTKGVCFDVLHAPGTLRKKRSAVGTLLLLRRSLMALIATTRKTPAPATANAKSKEDQLQSKLMEELMEQIKKGVHVRPTRPLPDEEQDEKSSPEPAVNEVLIILFTAALKHTCAGKLSNLTSRGNCEIQDTYVLACLAQGNLDEAAVLEVAEFPVSSEESGEGLPGILEHNTLFCFSGHLVQQFLKRRPAECACGPRLRDKEEVFSGSHPTRF
ncbi:hypothetical protein HPB48_022585 [Haemaphysalis longicornis]|uniref:Uncharacterized protein n=1 Tax=Haemaphysalis longicornis TaxID=44386 RepID=A0A9J6FCG5_HAELO|nr:hypothetical protein HPB48_022585 [Haemaphysalis longicornis]